MYLNLQRNSESAGDQPGNNSHLIRRLSRNHVKPHRPRKPAQNHICPYGTREYAAACRIQKEIAGRACFLSAIRGYDTRRYYHNVQFSQRGRVALHTGPCFGSRGKNTRVCANHQNFHSIVLSMPAVSRIMRSCVNFRAASRACCPMAWRISAFR